MTTRAFLGSRRLAILRRIASCRTGEVFLATDRNLNSAVLMNIPHASMLRDAEFAARLRLQIQTLVRLQHRSTVSTLHADEVYGVPFAYERDSSVPFPDLNHHGRVQK